MSDRLKNEPLSVEEAKERLYAGIGKKLDWKFLKSKKIYKKVIEDLVFELSFFSSKWNESYKTVEIQCEFRMWCKKLGNCYNVTTAVGFLSLNPLESSWWNITSVKEIENTLEKLCTSIENNILPIVQKFEADFLNAVNELAAEPLFSMYHIRIQFIDSYSGREKAIEASKIFLASLNEREKNEIEHYRQGARNKACMINPSNLRYIIDTNLI